MDILLDRKELIPRFFEEQRDLTISALSYACRAGSAEMVRSILINYTDVSLYEAVSEELLAMKFSLVPQGLLAKDASKSSAPAQVIFQLCFTSGFTPEQLIPGSPLIEELNNRLSYSKAKSARLWLESHCRAPTAALKSFTSCAEGGVRRALTETSCSASAYDLCDT